MFGRATIRLGIGPHSSFCVVPCGRLQTKLATRESFWAHVSIVHRILRKECSQKLLVMVALCSRADHYILWSSYVIGQTIYIFMLFLLSSFFFYFLAISQPSEIRCLPYFHTWCGLSANLECAARGWLKIQDAKMTQKIAILAQSHNFDGLYLRNEGTYRQSEKKLLSSDMSSTCPHNMVNCKFQWVTRLGSVTARYTLVVGVSQTLRR